MYKRAISAKCRAISAGVKIVKIQKNIEIVRTNQLGLSSLSMVSAEAICAVLSKHYSNVQISIVNSLSDLNKVIVRTPDLVFMGLKFLPSSAGPVWVSEYFASHGVSHTGSTRNAIRFGLNKVLAKQLVLEVGLSSPRYEIINNYVGYSHEAINLKFPLFVKPAASGGGFGIDAQSVVGNLAELNSKLANLAAEKPSGVIIEEYLPGREFSVGILKDISTGELRAMPIELAVKADVNGNRILSQQVKSQNQETVSYVSDSKIRGRVIKLALEAFVALGGRDYGRLDIRLDAAGNPNFLEVNFIPSLIEDYGSFPKACSLNIGLEYEDLVLQIAELGLSRESHENVGSLIIDSPLLFPSIVPVASI